MSNEWRAIFGGLPVTIHSSEPFEFERMSNGNLELTDRGWSPGL